MDLGSKICKLRKNANISQEQLAEKLDVTRQTISNWESEDTAPNPEQLKRLSKVFDISIDELLDNEYKSKEILINKVSNTEKLAGMIIKILKVFGIIVILYLIFVAVALIALFIYSQM